MKDGCLDIGTLQAFMDGELSHPESARVSSHIAHCDACAVALSNSEEESALVFSMIEREFDTLVPTQRLWSKINDSIESDTSGRSVWASVKAYIASAVASPSLAGAVGLVLLFTIFTTLWLQRTPFTDQLPEMAAKGGSPAAASMAQNPSRAADANLSGPSQSTGDVAVDNVIRPRERATISSAATISAERASYRVEPRRTSLTPENRATGMVSGYLPGEEGFVKTIATLEKTVAEQKDAVLRPSERIAYERDMAMVNDTISRLRSEAKKNPRNGSIKQVLYSSYQNKIDLLNAVSDKEELVATLK
jgi:anti-sigma factor RsiW